MSILQAAPTGLALSLGWKHFPSEFPLHPAEEYFSPGLWSLQIYFPIGNTRFIFKFAFMDKIFLVYTDQFNPKDFHMASRDLELAMTKNQDQRYINQNQGIPTGCKPKGDYVDL